MEVTPAAGSIFRKFLLFIDKGKYWANKKAKCLLEISALGQKFPTGAKKSDKLHYLECLCRKGLINHAYFFTFHNFAAQNTQVRHLT
jgi:hypothetical protein